MKSGGDEPRSNKCPHEQLPVCKTLVALRSESLNEEFFGFPEIGQ